MALRRGFKTEANSLAGEVRWEPGPQRVRPARSVRADRASRHPRRGLSTVRPVAPAAVDHFLRVEPDAFSATTVFAGARRSIVFNDQYAIGRQNSSIVHEAWHGLLFHEPCQAMDDLGCRRWDADIEDEAMWLASVLLVPEDAALAVARGRWDSEPAAAEHFGVSTALRALRPNMTGARRRVARAAAHGRRGQKRPA